MTNTVGGNIEQKPIGLKFGIAGSGEYFNIEIINNTVQLSQQTTENGINYFNAEGVWISEVIDIGDVFNDYGKLFTIDNNDVGSAIAVQTRTSNNGIDFDEWLPINVDGGLQSVKRQFIQVKIIFFAGIGNHNYSVINKIELNNYVDGEKENFERINPTLTSNTSSDEGYAFSSSNVGTTYLPWRAFDNTEQVGFRTNSLNEGFVGFSFNEPKLINYYRICSSTVAQLNYLVKDWRLEASNDTSNGTDGKWMTLDSRSDQIWAQANEYKGYYFNNQTPFKAYRLYLLKNNGYASSIQVQELEFGFVNNLDSLKLKNIYVYDTQKDDTWSENGHLSRLLIKRDNYKRLDGVKVIQSKESSNRTLIYHNGEYKKFVRVLGESGGSLVPIMTSNNSNGIILTASSVSSTNEPYKAFDEIIAQSSDLWRGSSQNGWLRVDFGNSPKTVASYKLHGSHISSWASQVIKNWTFEGSNDLTNWVVLDQRTNETLNNSTVLGFKEYKIDESKIAPYRAYRINGSSSATNYIVIGEMQLIGKVVEGVEEWVVLNNIDIQTEGMSDLSNLEKRQVRTLPSIPMTSTSLPNINNNNPFYSKVIDLHKYIDIRDITSNVSGDIKLCSVGDYENLINFTSIEDIYSFEDDVEVIMIPSELNTTEVNLIITANYSPLDELNGDFEIVTWNESSDEGSQVEVSAIPHGQFLKFTSPISLLNKVGKLTPTSNSQVRFLFSPDNIQWYKWNNDNFALVDTSSNELIEMNGNTVFEVNNIDSNHFMNKWNYNTFSVGIFLNDDLRDRYTTYVSDLSLTESYYATTPIVSNISFYILNTTARIDVTLEGTVLRAILSDDDLGRVQYRVLLNDQPYRYSEVDEEGWNQLTPSPYNINMNLYDEEIIIPNDNNTIRIEFRDAFGTEDYWEGVFFAKKMNGKFTYSFIMDI